MVSLLLNSLPVRVYKKEVRAHLQEIGWQPREPIGLPTLIGTYATKVPVDAVIH
jgi:hypothetical protein